MDLMDKFAKVLGVPDDGPREMLAALKLAVARPSVSLLKEPLPEWLTAARGAIAKAEGK